MSTSNLSSPSSSYIRRIVGIHLDPKGGTPYWLERDRRLERNARENVADFDDFLRLVGFRNLEEQRTFESDTRYKRLEEFIPLSILQSDRTIWASQTGGTTGPPKHGNWDSFYWEKILEFSDEFLDLHDVPRSANWLFIGPSGPHTTGRLIVSIAEHRRGRCFSVDLDPRIVKIYGTAHMTEAYERYVQHIWDQVESIIRYQKIDVMFCTSRLLELLPEYLDIKLFRSVKAIVHAGTSMTRETELLLRTHFFPGVPLVGIYGTSTTGISYQKPPEPEDDGRVIYIPSSPYIVLHVVDDAGQLVRYGSEGHVATYRLTEDSLIPGFWERDRALRIKPFGRWAESFGWDWVSEIYSPQFTTGAKVEGVY
jgi:thienamycin biosynthesis protein ThnN